MRIRDLFLSTKVGVDGRFLWGQFLEPGEGQFGLFGTAAAIEVLSPDSAAREFVTQAAEWLATIASDEQHPARERGDLLSVFKVAAVTHALAEARAAGIVKGDLVTPLAKMLLEMRGRNDAWSDVNAADAVPRLLPTAVSLHALSVSDDKGVREACVIPLCWLIARIADGAPNLRPFELALAGLALQSFHDMHERLDGYSRALDAVPIRFFFALAI